MESGTAALVCQCRGTTFLFRGGARSAQGAVGGQQFDRGSGRQPKLTEAGTALLEEAREVLRQCERLNGRALAMMRGQEASLRVAQDEAMPYQAVVESFEALAEQFPSLEVQLTSAAQGEVSRKLVERRA